MATVNVYVPDELKARLEKANLNLSSFAQEAWEAALHREELSEGEVSVDAADRDGNAVELRFTGSFVAHSDKNGTDLYLTDEDNLVWVDDDGQFDSFPRSEVDQGILWNLFRDWDAVAVALGAFGLKRVVRL